MADKVIYIPETPFGEFFYDPGERVGLAVTEKSATKVNMSESLDLSQFPRFWERSNCVHYFRRLLKDSYMDERQKLQDIMLMRAVEPKYVRKDVEAGNYSLERFGGQYVFYIPMDKCVKVGRDLVDNFTKQVFGPGVFERYRNGYEFQLSYSLELPPKSDALVNELQEMIEQMLTGKMKKIVYIPETPFGEFFFDPGNHQGLALSESGAVVLGMDAKFDPQEQKNSREVYINAEVFQRFIEGSLAKSLSEHKIRVVLEKLVRA